MNFLGVLLKIILVTFSFILISISAFSQNKHPEYKESKERGVQLRTFQKQREEFNKQNERAGEIINQIKTAISKNDIESLSAHLSAQTYLNLPNGISGYYSSNQAYFVLEDFLKTYRMISFGFNEINTSGNNPFATGNYDYEFKGKRGSAHIYLQLRNSGKSWTITQITIN